MAADTNKLADVVEANLPEDKKEEVLPEEYIKLGKTVIPRGGMSWAKWSKLVESSKAHPNWVEARSRQNEAPDADLVTIEKPQQKLGSGVKKGEAGHEDEALKETPQTTDGEGHPFDPTEGIQQGGGVSTAETSPEKKAAAAKAEEKRQLDLRRTGDEEANPNEKENDKDTDDTTGISGGVGGRIGQALKPMLYGATPDSGQGGAGGASGSTPPVGGVPGGAGEAPVPNVAQMNQQSGASLGDVARGVALATPMAPLVEAGWLAEKLWPKDEAAPNGGTQLPGAIPSAPESGGMAFPAKPGMPAMQPGIEPEIDDDERKRAELEARTQAKQAILATQDAITDISQSKALVDQKQIETEYANSVAADGQKEKIANTQREMDRAQAAGMATMEEVARLSATKVDPNRFWNSRGGGEKAAAIIAGALFGFTGQGMTWLKRLDSLVEQDVRMQENDLSRRIQGQEAKAKAQFNARDYAKERGALDTEAYEIDKQVRYKALEMAVQDYARTTTDANARVNAMEKVAQLAQAGADSVRRQQEFTLRVVEAKNQVIDHHNSQQIQLAHLRVTMYDTELKKLAMGGEMTKGAQATERKVAALREAEDEAGKELTRLGGRGYLQNLGSSVANGVSSISPTLGGLVPGLAVAGPGEVAKREQLISRLTKNSEVTAPIAKQIELAMRAAKDTSPGGTAVYAGVLQQLYDSVRGSRTQLERMVPNGPTRAPAGP